MGDCLERQEVGDMEFKVSLGGVPPPIPLVTTIKNHFAWGVVASMAIPWVLIFPATLIVAGYGTDVYLVLTYLILIMFGSWFLTIWLCLMDMKSIEAVMPGTMDFNGTLLQAICFSPIYLYVRANRTKKKPTQFYAWLFLMLLVLLGVVLMVLVA